MNENSSPPSPSTVDGQVTANTELNLPSSLPGIDIASGLRMCNSSVTLYLNMLKKFRISKRNEADVVRSLFAAGERDTATRTAHSMKSVSATLGATELSTAARLLEEALSKNLDDQLPERLDNFQEALEALLLTLDAEFGENQACAVHTQPSSSSGVCDSEALKNLAKKLDAALDTDMRLAINLAAEMNKVACNPELKALNDEIQDSITCFDVDAAHATLKKLIGLLI